MSSKSSTQAVGEHMRADRMADLGKGKTCRWDIINVSTGEALGCVAWKYTWRRYVFYPFDGTLFDAACLQDLAGFLERVKDVRR